MMSADELQLALKLQSIFMPHALDQRETFERAHGRFVHYTSAEAGLSIIRTKRVWMRNTTCMSDYSEVQHGRRLLHLFFSNEANRAGFVSALDACADGLAQEVFTLFDQWWNEIQFQSYVTSVSEHDPREDRHGRLSMWRAFLQSP
jgi:hypothetical protein